MYVTLVSLILQAALALTQAHVAVTPFPFDRIVHALASAHSYRVVFTSTQAANGLTTTASTMVVRHGSAVQTYTALTAALHGQKAWLLDERVDTGTRDCLRPTHTAPWRCTPRPQAAHTGQWFPDYNTTLRTLHWTRVPNASVQGRLCRGYRTIWQPSPGMTTRVTLWIAPDSSRPVEVTATTSTLATAPGQTTSQHSIIETAVWSAWNSPTLQVPRV